LVGKREKKKYEKKTGTLCLCPHNHAHIYGKLLMHEAGETEQLVVEVKKKKKKENNTEKIYTDIFMRLVPD
jgi:hypothetical protein